MERTYDFEGTDGAYLLFADRIEECALDGQTLDRATAIMLERYWGNPYQTRASITEAMRTRFAE